MEMEIGRIESFRFIVSPPVKLKHTDKPWKMGRRKPPGWERKKREMDSFWKPLYKSIRSSKPRVTAQRSASSRKRKAIWHAVSRRVPNGYIAFV